MLLDLALADAYGVGFEFRSADFVRANNRLERYFPHERYTDLYRKYSDDTQLSIALAELMLEGANWTPENIANQFVKVFQRDVRPGYSSRMYDALMQSKDGIDFIRRIDNQSEGSGAAMRSAVLGLLKTEEELLEKAAIQAKVTHDTTSAVLSSQAVALGAHYFAYGLGPKNKVSEYIESFIGGNWHQEWTLPVKSKGTDCVLAALTAIQGNDNQADLLQDCIAFTGDVDTVAAIALGMIAFSTEVEANLPSWMYEELEDGPYGRDYLQTIDQKLYHKFTIRNNP